jgi:hypothetical protein
MARSNKDDTQAPADFDSALKKCSALSNYVAKAG